MQAALAAESVALQAIPDNEGSAYLGGSVKRSPSVQSLQSSVTSVQRKDRIRAQSMQPPLSLGKKGGGDRGSERGSERGSDQTKAPPARDKHEKMNSVDSSEVHSEQRRVHSEHPQASFAFESTSLSGTKVMHVAPISGDHKAHSAAVPTPDNSNGGAVHAAHAYVIPRPVSADMPSSHTLSPRDHHSVSRYVALKNSTEINNIFMRHRHACILSVVGQDRVWCTLLNEHIRLHIALYSHGIYQYRQTTARVL